jgi:hypothetical protein
MSHPDWIATPTRLPADGQAVLVKTLHGDVEHRVTFSAKPEPRWVTRSLITSLELYAYWRPAPPLRARPTHEVRAAL